MQTSVKRDVRVGETLRFLRDGVVAQVTLIAKSGQRARLQITADDSVTIDSQEPVSAAKPPQGLGQFTG